MSEWDEYQKRMKAREEARHDALSMALGRPTQDSPKEVAEQIRADERARVIGEIARALRSTLPGLNEHGGLVFSAPGANRMLSWRDLIDAIESGTFPPVPASPSTHEGEEDTP